jgi:formylglycine-generating enzyme required for sulfatase activity
LKAIPLRAAGLLSLALLLAFAPADRCMAEEQSPEPSPAPGTDDPKKQPPAGEDPGKPETPPEPAPEPEKPEEPGKPDAPAEPAPPAEPTPPPPEPPAEAPKAESSPAPVQDVGGMVWIAPAEAKIGSTPKEVTDAAGQRKDVLHELIWETPVHPVPLSGYYIDPYEVTNEQYRLFVETFKTTYTTGTRAIATLAEMATHFVHGGDKRSGEQDTVSWRQIYEINKETLRAALPDLDTVEKFQHAVVPPDITLVAYACRLPDHWPGAKASEGQEKHPVRFVSYEDAEKFAEWAGKHVPTEAEWEYAARGPDRRDYPWGSEWVEKFDIDGNRIVEKRAVWSKTAILDTKIGQPTTAAVDAYPEGRSWCGLHHTSGNVAEWTSSWIQRYPKALIPTDNPLALRGYEGVGFAKVIRGGSLGDADPLALRLSARNLLGKGRSGPPRPQNRFDYVGFRLAAYKDPGRDVVLPAVERLDKGGWLKHEQNPVVLHRFAGAAVRHWTAPGETSENHVYVKARAQAIVLAPRTRVFDLEEKVRSRKAKDVFEDAVDKDPVILGVFHTDVALAAMDVASEPPPEKDKDNGKKKKRKDKPEAPYTARGTLPAGSYVVGAHFNRLGLYKRNLELAAFFPGPPKTTDKNLKKDEAPPASKLTLDLDADIVKGEFWIATGGKNSKPEEGFLVSFFCEAESGALAKVAKGSGRGWEWTGKE